MGSNIPSILSCWMVYKNYCSSVSNSLTCVFLDASKTFWIQDQKYVCSNNFKKQLFGNFSFSWNDYKIMKSFFVVEKKNCQKVDFLSYLNKHIFGLEFKIFRLRVEIHMLMSWKPTSNNSYRLFNNSRLTLYWSPQRRVWKWLIKIIAHCVLVF